MKPDQTRVGALLIDTVSLLCRNGLNFTTDIKVQGLLGITIDGTDVFLVHFNETFTENQPTASVETQSARSSDTSEQAAVEGREDNPDGQNQMAAKPTFRKTGFPLSAGPRHRYGALPLGMQARRRARQLGTSISQRMRVNSKSVEVGPTRSTDLPPVAESDEKPDCSGYANIKTEADIEQLMQNIPEEQDEVILVESEDGVSEQDRVLPSDMDSGGAYLKTEERSEFSTDPVYSYNDSYEQFDPSSSDLGHGAEVGDPGTFSSYGRNSSDIKPMIQMQTCPETWNTPQLEWNSSQNSQTIASKYGRMPMGLTHDLSNQDNIEHMSATAHFRSSPARYSSRSRVLVTRHRQATSESRDTEPAQFRDCILELGQASRNWQATETIEKCFVCRLCGAAMRHRRNLLRHQITVHGRKKNPRGRPPTSSY